MMEEKHFNDLLASVREAGAMMRGELESARVTRYGDVVRSNPLDPRAIRAQLGLTRAQFAALLAVSERTVEGWEQGRRCPSGPTLLLLRVAAKHPEIILDTVRPHPGH